MENRDNKSAENKFDKANFVLMTKDLTKSKIFVAEAAKSAAINTACTKTAAFKPVYNYMSNLSEDIKNTTSNILKFVRKTQLLNLMMAVM